MAEQQKNAQVLNGINDDITELKSLTTLRKRVVSNGEIVSKSANEVLHMQMPDMYIC